MPLEVGISVATSVLPVELAVFWKARKVLLLDKAPSEEVVIVMTLAGVTLDAAATLEAGMTMETVVELAVLIVDGIGTCNKLILLGPTEVVEMEDSVDIGVAPGLVADEVPADRVMGLPMELAIPTALQSPRTKSKLVA